MTRPSQRAVDALRDIQITRGFTKHAEGSALIQFGNTKVLCNASVIAGVPRFLKGSGQGWVTAEYGMLPRSTHSRMGREAAIGKQSGRTQEIQRLIGRSLRTCLDLNLLGDYTITIDCDVLQADGGTRTAAITGGCLALREAISFMLEKKMLMQDPFKQHVAAVSAGLFQDKVVLDLDYLEDSGAQADMNFVMNESGLLIEVQGTAEKRPFSQDEFNQMFEFARSGIKQLIAEQTAALD